MEQLDCSPASVTCKMRFLLLFACVLIWLCIAGESVRKETNRCKKVFSRTGRIPNTPFHDSLTLLARLERSIRRDSVVSKLASYCKNNTTLVEPGSKVIVVSFFSLRLHLVCPLRRVPGSGMLVRLGWTSHMLVCSYIQHRLTLGAGSSLLNEAGGCICQGCQSEQELSATSSGCFSPALCQLAMGEGM